MDVPTTTCEDRKARNGDSKRKSSDIAERKPSVLPSEQAANGLTQRSTDIEQPGHADPEDDFPEGGLRAWLVVLSAVLTLYPSFGLMVSIGTLQDYWSTHQLSAYRSRDVGWIASVFVYLSLALGIWIGPLFDAYGPRWIAGPGSAGYVAMLFGLAHCSRFWTMLLVCGLGGGITGAALTTTSLAVVAHWFKRRRALAQGLAMAGSSFAGLTIPLVLHAALPRYGYPWSIRILAFLFAACLLLANLLMRARLPPRAALPPAHRPAGPPPPPQPIISLRIFADLRFGLLATAVFGYELVLFGALGILPTYATLVPAYPPQTAFYIIAVLNGSSCLGRALPGYAADRIGRFNTLLLSLVAVELLMLALWLPFGATSLPALYGFVALFGFGSGCWMALTPACIGQLCRADEFGRYYGSCYFVASLATLVCVPISGELVQQVGAQAMVGFYSAVLGVATECFAGSRWACLGWSWRWRAKV